MSPGSALPDDQVTMLGGPFDEPDPSAAQAKLANTIRNEPYASVIRKYGLEFGARIGGGYYSDVFQVKVTNKNLGSGQGPLKMVVKIVDAALCPKRSNYINELVVCKFLQVCLF